MSLWLLSNSFDKNLVCSVEFPERPWLADQVQGLLGLRIEQVHLVHVDHQVDLFAGPRLRARIDAGDELLLAGQQVQVDFVAHQLGDIHLGGHRRRRDAGRLVLGGMHILGPDAEDDLLALARHVHLALVLGHQQLEGAAVDEHLAVLLHQRDVEEVHRRAADEAGGEDVARMVVELLRRVDLLQQAVLQHGDAARHGHGLHLVVGDVDEGGAQALVQLADVGAGLHAQFRVQVRQRFVEQEDGWAAHDRPAHGHALALAAGELFRLAVEELADAQKLGSFLDFLVDLSLGHLAQLEAERHVVVYAHVWVERVALEHHGDVAILGWHIVDDAVADEDAAVGNLFQTGQHA